MIELLKNTHRKENIDLLKARDYYFDKARVWNNWSRFFVLLPPIILALTYLPFLSSIKIIDDKRDILIGVISIVSFLIIHFVCKERKEKYFEISNAIREVYDCNTFKLPRNPFAYGNKNLSEYIDKCKYVNDYYKYEIWYKEIFCDSHPRNVLIAQMDNMVYTYEVYKNFKLFIAGNFIIAMLLSIVSLYFGIYVFVLVLISMFNVVQDCMERLSNTNDLIKRNYGLMNIVKTENKHITERLDRGDMSILRMLQDVVISNRNQSLFIPKYIRKRYLREDSIFYKTLNEFKSIYLDKQTTCIPSSAEELEIFNIEETSTIKLKEIQERLLEMIEDTKKIFEKYNITYTMDGGTLIGAVRNKNIENPSEEPCLIGGGFVFWDDDIDIAIPTTDGMLEKAKEVIRKELGEKYDVQDYVSDTYYSPRLSNFRIRDKRSVITEKDSPLFDMYRSRGLFIDIYAYTPILYNKFFDSLYRRCFIHPLYKKIKKTELRYPSYRNPINDIEKDKLNKCLEKFCSQKKKYIGYVNWYLKHAKNEEYYVYTPNYIENLGKAGPYIKKEFLYGEKKTAQFENLRMPIPSSPAEVLNAYYGKWYISPFKTISMLKKEYGEEKWFDKNLFVVSVMKHIDHVDIDDVAYVVKSQEKAGRFS